MRYFTWKLELVSDVLWLIVARKINSLGQVQKIAFLQIRSWVFFKKYRAKYLEETGYHPA